MQPESQLCLKIAQKYASKPHLGTKLLVSLYGRLFHIELLSPLSCFTKRQDSLVFITVKSTGITTEKADIFLDTLQMKE